MRKSLLFFVLFSLVVHCFAKNSYRCGEEHISLTPMNTSTRFVKLKDNPATNQILKQQKKAITNLADYYCLIDSTLIPKVNVLFESNIYKSEHDYTIVLLPEIVISLTDENYLSKILKQYSKILFLKKKNKERYILSCNYKTSEDVLKLANELANKDGVRWCKPGMLSEIKYENNGDNPYFSNQYYLHNRPYGSNTASINAVNAWEIVSGNPNIKVAVIDQGVERNHEDLQGVVLDGYTCNMPAEKGDPIHENSNDSKGHGTACAGIIAAVDNNKGIKGVAAGVKILPINISPDYVSYVYNNYTKTYERIGYMANPEDIADAIDWAVSNGADVISCSWSHESDIDIANSFANARTYGRNGKGCVIVASSGNYYHKGVYAAGFPANLQGTLCVGAVERNCSIWYYSQRGTTMDLVAPSGDVTDNADIYTTDRMEANGYTSGNYMDHFGGTSAACPQVAGVAALMLSINPDLTETQVRTTLQQTARDLGSKGFDTTYGYGLVDAYAAVYAVAAHKILGPHLVCESGTYSIENLPNGVTVEWSLSDSYYNQNCLQQNYPSQNQCTITRDSYDMMDATLTATIKHNGKVIQTLTKSGLYAYRDFMGHYTSGDISGDINYTHYLRVKRNFFTYIYSPNLIDGNASYNSTGVTPLYWQFYPDLGRLYFTVPNDVNYPVVVIDVDDVCGNHYQLYALPDSYYYLNTSTGDNSITVTLEENENYDESRGMEQPWTLEIRNASTGELKATKTETGKSAYISTTGWTKGIYVIKANVEKEILTEKFMVK